MASPVGHAAVGLATATIVARVAEVPDSLALWIGALVASGLPDLDVVAPLLGLPRRWHRGPSHSLITVLVLIALGWLLLGWLNVEPRFLTWLVWSSALLSHLFLDVVTTGPTLARLNWGIPIFWPVSQRRYSVERPWLVGDREESNTVRDTVREMGVDLVRIVPVCGVVIFVARMWL